MQQGGSQYGVSPEMAPFAARTQMLGGTDHTQQQQAVAEAEAASPISSRPPAHSSAGNFDELLPVPGGLPDDDALAAGDETDRGGISGGNRWPRQETLALLKIRSEMDVAFRDATLKGPLWDEVSRKLAELGYRRSAKKCKEKFENVHKYYKRTKEGRAGRQDGKSYRFFTQLEALHTTATTSNSNSNVSTAPPMASTPTTTNTNTNTTAATTTPTTTTNLVVAPVSIGIGISNPMPVSSVRILPSISATASQAPSSMGAFPMFPPDLSVGMAPAVSGSAAAAIGINFSSNSSSSSSSGSEEEDEEEEDDLEGEPSNTDSSRGRKRKRSGSSKGTRSSSSRRMMEFFEGLMKQVMHKQESMQQRFLETIEKREQDRMIREEAWKRQEITRLAREHELMSQERAISASRDAAIIAFLQKITGQTIQLPPPVTIPAAPPPPPAAPVQPPPPPPQQQQQHQQQVHQHHQQRQQQQQQLHHHHHQSQNAEVLRHQPPPVSSEIVVAVPEQQVPPQEMGGGGSFDPTSSRWPKAEVLALIKLRSGLEAKYQEAGPKGPLWEEISAGMQRLGYKRNSKRCKEKWENINKYFKKVKESNKKRPEDAKTCPYFHQLDALYRKKILGSTSGGGGGGGSSSSSFGNQNRPEQQQESMTLDPIPTTKVQDRSGDVPVIMPAPQSTAQATESENKKGDNIDVQQATNGGLPANLFGEGSSTSSAGGGAKKPEDIVKELMGQQPRELMMDEYDKIEEPDSDNLDQEENEDEEEDDEEESEDDSKLAYKIEFQRQNAAGSSNGGGNGAPSFVAMVQ